MSEVVFVCAIRHRRDGRRGDDRRLRLVVVAPRGANLAEPLAVTRLLAGRSAAIPSALWAPQEARAPLAGDESADSWFDLLSQLDADPEPFWVVADGSKAIRSAVEAIWPNASFYPCEHHLRENALEHAKKDGALGEPGIEQAIKQAFYGIEAWEHLGELVKALARR